MNQNSRPMGIPSDSNRSDFALVVASSGAVELRLQQEIVTLGDGDTALLTRVSDTSLHVTPVVPADCYLVLLRECRDQTGSE